MFKLDKTDLQRIAVSAVAALALSATSILAAVGPVRAADVQAAPVASVR